MGIFVLIPVISATISIVLGVRSIVRGESDWSRPLALMFGATAFWSLGYIGELLHPDMGGKLWWDNVQFIGYSLIAPAVLVFTLQFLDYPLGWRKSLWIVLAIEPVVTNVLVWTDRYQHLIRSDAELLTLAGLDVLVYTWGPWLMVSTALTLSISLVSLVLIGFRTAMVPARYRSRMLTLIVGILIPWIGGFLATVGFASPWVSRLDVSPLFVTIGFSVIMWASRSQGFFSIPPSTYRKVIERMPDGLVVIAHDGTILDANPAVGAMFGIEASTVGGMPVETLLPAPIIEESLRIGEDSGATTVTVPDQNTLRHFSLRTRPLLDTSGGVTGQLILVRDITEQIHAQQELDRLKSEVDAVVQHDIRSPLIGILSAVDLLRSEDDVAVEHGHLLNAIEESGTKVLAILNQALTLVRIEQGRFNYRPEPVSLVNVLSGCTTDLSGLATLRGVQVESIIDVPEEAPPGTGDETFAYMICTNLLRNAIEASSGGATVTISLRTTEGWYTIDIHNETVVPPKIRAIFFEKYATADKEGGTGFGTYIAKMLADAQKWGISMTTSAEAGTTLTLNVPIYRNVSTW